MGIRNGNKFNTTHSERMTVVSVTNGFYVSKSSFDYLYRDKMLAKIMRLWFFFTFYVKVLVRMFLRSVNYSLPRFNFELAHPQHATHCLMWLKHPRVPITNGRAIWIP